MNEKAKKFIDSVNESYQQILNESMFGSKKDKETNTSLTGFMKEIALSSGKVLDWSQGVAFDNPHKEFDSLVKSGILQMKKDTEVGGAKYVSYTLTGKGMKAAKGMKEYK